MESYAGQTKLIWRHLPLTSRPQAELTAQAATEAYAQQGSDGFWRLHDLFFANLPTKDRPDVFARSSLDAYASQLGLDIAKWKDALDTEIHKGEVAADTSVGAKAGLDRLPAFLINGFLLEGDQPARKFRRLINQALAEVR